MNSQLSTNNTNYHGNSRLAVKILFVALVYFACGRFGLEIPYLSPHITLVWIPSGVAVAVLMRWGYNCWPGIYIGAMAANFSIDSSPLLDSAIAIGNTLAPLLVVWLLRRLQFQSSFDRTYDIMFLVVAAAIGMLVSACVGVGSLLIFKLMPMRESVSTLLSWWTGNFVGVLVLAPLLLNISREELGKLWVLRTEFMTWSLIMLTTSWIVFALNDDVNHDSMVFILFPVLVWSAMRFGVAGSSLGVLIPAFIGVMATRLGMGPFYTADVNQGVFLLWLFLATLALVSLMVVALQAGRKQAEAGVQQSELRFHQMFARHNSIMLLIDPESGRIMDANESASQFYGYPRERLLTMDIAQINTLPPDEIAAERIQAKKENRNYFVFPHRLSSGTVRMVEVHSSPIDMAGHTLLFSVIHDITERENAEQAIREAKERIEIIFNTSRNAVLISRLSDGSITDANDAFVKLTGYTKEQVVGNTTLGIKFWVNPEDRERYVSELKAKGYCEDFETQFRRNDGSIFVCSVSAGITTIQGVQHIIGTARDITETQRIHKQTETLLSRYQTLMKTALDGFRVMDIQGNIVEANDAFCRMLGYTHEEALELNIADWDAQWTKEELLDRLKGFVGKSARFETVQRRKDGTLIDVEVSTTGVEIEGQNYFFASSRDITERKRAEQKNEVLMRRHHTLMKSALEGIHIMDEYGNIVEVNDTFCRMLGYTQDEMAKLNVADWDAQWSREELMERFKKLIRIDGALFETRHRRKDSSQFDVEVSTTGAEIDGHYFLYASSRDITERKRADAALRIAAITFDTQEGIMITDADAKILRVNQAFQNITGYNAADVIGKNPRMFQSGKHDVEFFRAMWSDLLDTGKWAGEVWDKRKDGEIYPKLMTITAVYDEKNRITNYVAVFRDISNRKKSEQEIHQLAFYDSLTKLPNRRLLLDRLQQGLAISSRSSRYGALLFLDMDHFKTINDTQGHAMGDQLLIEVAHRLQTCVREGDSVARLGGDEFVVVLEGLSTEADEAANHTELVAEKIRMELDKPYMLNDYEFLSTVSIGISLFCNHKESAEDLLRHADVAMYQAKMAGRNTIRFFDPRMQMALEARAAMEADLRHALAKRQFHLCYQVQVDSLRRPLGAEVLLRWTHPERGEVSPTQFIPLAEETGLIVPVGLWVLQTACAQLKQWQGDARTRDLVLSVNVSAKQFRQPDFVAQAQRILMESGAKPSHLKMEFTESTVLENVEDTISKMRELKILGVGFSVDDFGTGYSSLQYLKRLPLDQIKIDQSFVHDIASDPNDAAIVQTIIAMTEALGLNVIAEGVETMAQFEFLDSHGCHAFQGYLFSMPVPLEQFENMLLGENNSSRHNSALP